MAVAVAQEPAHLVQTKLATYYNSNLGLNEILESLIFTTLSSKHLGFVAASFFVAALVYGLYIKFDTFVIRILIPRQ